MSRSAEIVADSLHPNGKDRVTTMRVRYERWIHSEMMTHRAFSKNASSSRAIPFIRFAKWVGEDPAIPIRWGKHQAGMQAREVLDPDSQEKCRSIWLDARDKVLQCSEELYKLGLAKEALNRLLEPWHHITVVVTGNRAAYANFFALRCHLDAQPEIQALGCEMLRQYHASNPREMDWNEWHLPFVSFDERKNLFEADACRISAARCARTSYLTFEGTAPDPVKDLALYEKLAGSVPMHLSPTEHQARPRNKTDEGNQGGNLGPDWIQFRKTIPSEYLTNIPSYAYELAGIQR